MRGQCWLRQLAFSAVFSFRTTQYSGPVWPKDAGGLPGKTRNVSQIRILRLGLGSEVRVAILACWAPPPEPIAFAAGLSARSWALSLPNGLKAGHIQRWPNNKGLAPRRLRRWKS